MSFHRFTIVIEMEEHGGYHVFCPILKGCHTCGDTKEEAIKNIRKAIFLHMECMNYLRKNNNIPENNNIKPEFTAVNAEKIIYLATECGFTFYAQEGMYIIYYRKKDDLLLFLPANYTVEIKPKALAGILKDMDITLEEYNNIKITRSDCF